MKIDFESHILHVVSDPTVYRIQSLKQIKLSKTVFPLVHTGKDLQYAM